MTLNPADYTDPHSELIQQAQDQRSCDICKAPKTKPCKNTITPNTPLPGRLIHFGRTQDRTREPQGDAE